MCVVLCCVGLLRLVAQSCAVFDSSVSACCLVLGLIGTLTSTVLCCVRFLRWCSILKFVRAVLCCVRLLVWCALSGVVFDFYVGVRAVLCCV